MPAFEMGKDTFTGSDLKLLNSIENIAQKQNYSTYKIIIRKIPSNGLNYMGELTEANIKGITINGHEKEIDLFVKTKFPGENIKVLSMSDVYCNELYVYLELSRIYNELQEEYNVPIDERYKLVKCYDESDQETIIMENIAKKGYTSYERFNVISIDFAEKCIKELAKFHALSFVLENKQTKYFKEKIKPIKYPLLNNVEFDAFVRNMSAICIGSLDGEYRSKLEKFVPDITEKLQNRMCNTMKLRCLCHGDFRAMNVMMKVINGEVTNVIPIDYQFIFYGSPVTDIIYFLFGCTDRAFRIKHFVNLKYLYHNTLTNFLEHFHIDVNDYYSKEEFEKDFDECLDLSLMISVWYLPVNLADDDEVLDLNKTSASDVKFSVNERVKSRLEDVIDDLTEWGYLI